MSLPAFANKVSKTAKETAKYQGVIAGLQLSNRSITLDSVRSYVGKNFYNLDEDTQEQITEGATDLLIRNYSLKDDDAKVLDVQGVIEFAIQSASHSPYQGIENVLECAVGRILNLKGSVSKYKNQVSNFDEILEEFMSEENQEIIAYGRKKYKKEMAIAETKASKTEVNLIADKMQSGLVWSVSSQDMGFPFLSDKVEDAFGEEMEDGNYPFQIKESSWSSLSDLGEIKGITQLKNPKHPNFTNQIIDGEIKIKDGRIDILDFDLQIPVEYAMTNNHISVESFVIKDGVVRIFLGS